MDCVVLSEDFIAVPQRLDLCYFGLEFVPNMYGITVLFGINNTRCLSCVLKGKDWLIPDLNATRKKLYK